MGTIFVKELTGGLDARRLPETTPGGVLIQADNGHITRGGEFQARAAFVPEMTLPAGTVGLAHNRSGLVVFGSGPAPAGIGPFVQYQRLQTGGKDLARILDWELFDGKIYAIARFRDGTVAHFYDGVEDATWKEARARAVLQVISGTVEPAEQATAEFYVTGGVGEIINTLTSLTVSGTEIIAGPIVHTGDNATTAEAIADNINANPTTPGYDAMADGNRVVLTAQRAGAAANGRTIDWELTGNFTMAGATNFVGGSDEVVPTLNTLTIDGVNILRGPVEWPGTPEDMAAAIADAVSDLASDPEYEAFADGDRVVIHTIVEGTAQNGRPVADTTSGLLVLDYPDGQATFGGAALEADEFLPAENVLTVRERMYAGAASILHYSAITNPAFWMPGSTDPNEIGAGFTNVASSNSSSYRITGFARYFEKLAVFTPDTVQTWFLDPDPDLIVQSQVLENTGTECPRSVTQFGDADIFYLDASGLRSLRARDSSNAAATTDVGVPIDDVLEAKVAAMTSSQKENVIGLINPTDKRFWLIMGDEIFVYSYFPSSKVNAWTRYETTTTIDGERDDFYVTEAMTFDRRVFLRSGDTIYCYGGWGKAPVYDETPAIARLPMLDANSPTAEKDWRGVDAALSGEWEVSVSYDHARPDVTDLVSRLTDTSYGLRRIAAKNRSTHVGLTFKSGGGPAVLSSVVIHFEGKMNED